MTRARYGVLRLPRGTGLRRYRPRHRWSKSFRTWACSRAGCLVFKDSATGTYFDGATMDQGDEWKRAVPPCPRDMP